jgi:hypothetical protein
MSACTALKECRSEEGDGGSTAYEAEAKDQTPRSRYFQTTRNHSSRPLAVLSFKKLHDPLIYSYSLNNRRELIGSVSNRSIRYCKAANRKGTKVDDTCPCLTVESTFDVD